MKPKTVVEEKRETFQISTRCGKGPSKCHTKSRRYKRKD